MQKRCVHCKEQKEISEFSHNRTTKDGLSGECKACGKRHYIRHKERVKARVSEYAKAHQAEQKAYLATYRIEHEDHIKARNKAYYIKNKEIIKEKQQARKEQNIEQDRIQRNAYLREYNKKRREIDKDYHIIGLLRHRLWKAVRSKRQAQTIDYLGCSLQEFRDYLEAQFTEGMTWENAGEWHMDHYVPCSYFDLSEERNISICFHYLNIRPLWGHENVSKHSKLPSDTIQHIHRIETILDSSD